MNQPTFVYGVAHSELIFIPLETARDLAATRRALQYATTWGEFRSHIPQYMFEEALQQTFWEYMEPPQPGDVIGLAPDDSTPFKADDVFGHADGDWPAWPRQKQMDWLPGEISEKYGTMKTSVFNGDFLIIPAVNEQAIIEDLQTLGYCCLRDDQLTNLACGYDIPDPFEQESAPV